MHTTLGFLLLTMLASGHRLPAWIQPTSGMGLLQGGVFLDQDADGIWDEEEQGVTDVEIRFLHSSRATTVMSSPDGRFMLAADPGMWRVDLVIPEGYVALNDPTRLVWIGDEGVWEAEISFALQLNRQKQDDTFSQERALNDLQNAVFGELEATPSTSEMAADKNQNQAEDACRTGIGMLFLFSLLISLIVRVRRVPSGS